MVFAMAAHAAVVYGRVQDASGAFFVSLLAAKTCVAAVKEISLPKLELCGATLLAKLLKQVRVSIECKGISAFGWTDSTIVLAWLNGNSDRKTFVSNRITEITEDLPADCWQHVKSEENPADCASRGLSSEKLKEHKLWWTGPA